MNWQPIETAPKDKVILVSCTRRMTAPYTAMNDSRDGWVTETTDAWVAAYTPTHWMPLPAAPGKESPAALNLEAAAMKLAEVFDYPWEDMPAEGRQNMRTNAQAVLLAASFKESP